MCLSALRLVLLTVSMGTAACSLDRAGLFALADAGRAEDAGDAGGVDGSIQGCLPTQVPTVDQWWNQAWSRRRKLTFQNRVDEDLIDFPVLLFLDNSRGEFATAQSSYGDIRFVDADGQTELPYQIDHTDNGRITPVWVKIPKVSACSDSDHVWLYYGNGNASIDGNGAQVWSNGYRGVWHLETGAVTNDSSGMTVNGQRFGSTDVVGQIGRARSFDGRTDYIDTKFNENLERWTISAWVRSDAPPATSTNTQNGPLMRDGNFQLGWDNDDPALLGAASLRVSTFWKGASFRVPDAQASPAFDSTKWYWLAATYDGNELKSYLDGVRQVVTSAKGTPDTTTSTAKIARNATTEAGAGYFFKGSVDEVRISNVARSDAWLAAEHAAVVGQFVAIGPETMP